MSKEDPKLKTSVTVVDYDPNWAVLYTDEQKLLLATDIPIVEIEHFGSTAIPRQKAKAIIDIMVSIEDLLKFEVCLPILEKLGYELIETDMKDRYFLRRIDELTKQSYHLHIVSVESWDTRKERLMRDYLLEHPQEVQAYGTLKVALAQKYPNDSLAYTEGKTAFIHKLINKACDELSIPISDVWDD